MIFFYLEKIAIYFLNLCYVSVYLNLNSLIKSVILYKHNNKRQVFYFLLYISFYNINIMTDVKSKGVGATTVRTTKLAEDFPIMPACITN